MDPTIGNYENYENYDQNYINKDDFDTEDNFLWELVDNPKSDPVIKEEFAIPTNPAAPSPNLRMSIDMPNPGTGVSMFAATPMTTPQINPQINTQINPQMQQPSSISVPSQMSPASPQILSPVGTFASPGNFTQPLLSPNMMPLQQASMSAEEGAKTVKQVQERVSHFQKKLNELVNIQRQIFSQQGNNVQKLELQQQYVDIGNQMKLDLQALLNLNNTVLLAADDLNRIDEYEQIIRIQMKQVDLLNYELQSFDQGMTGKQCIAALVIPKQPFPIVMTKGKQLEDSILEVKLLTGVYNDIKSYSQIKAQQISDNHQAKSGPQSLEMECQSLDPNSLTTHFPLKFTSGTRKSPVNIRFSMQLQTSAVTSTIESESTKPFVIITNECQWEGSAGTLLKKGTYGGQLEVSWPNFVNNLQRHFIVATKQDPTRPIRCLSQFDLSYLHKKFFSNKTMIHQKDFDYFWGWFGKSMQTVRYQRHICSLWQIGIIYGFMGRDEVEAALLNQDPGTFIIRFSERHPGQFGIAYIGTSLETGGAPSAGGGASPFQQQQQQQSKIKHYLVQPNDTAASKKTLPDFLLECPQFVNILQLTTDEFGKSSLALLPKEKVLESFVNRSTSKEMPNGYEPLGS